MLLAYGSWGLTQESQKLIRGESKAQNGVLATRCGLDRELETSWIASLDSGAHHSVDDDSFDVPEDLQRGKSSLSPWIGVKCPGDDKIIELD